MPCSTFLINYSFPLVRIYNRDAWLVYKSGLYALLWKWLVPRCFHFYVNWDGIGVRSTLTIDRGRRKGAGFAYKLMQSVIFSHVLSASLPMFFYTGLQRRNATPYFQMVTWTHVILFIWTYIRISCSQLWKCMNIFATGVLVVGLITLSCVVSTFSSCLIANLIPWLYCQALSRRPYSTIIQLFKIRWSVKVCRKAF